MLDFQFELPNFRVYDFSASSINFITSSSLKRCMSFNEQVVVSGALALSMWIWKTTQVLDSQSTSMIAYHRRVKLVHLFPPLLSRLHDIDLLILQRPCLVHILHDSFGCVTKPTRTPSEEGNSTVEQTRCSTEHGLMMQRAIKTVVQRFRRLDMEGQKRKAAAASPPN